MHSIQWDGVMTALSSISHNGGQSFGITSKLRREKMVQPDGTVEDVPVISGNALRGMLRDVGMLHLCKALGYGEPDEDGRPRGLSLAAFYFLFSGGALTSTGARGLDLDAARQVRALIPLVGVFGGAMGNSILPGKLKMGKAIPICRETAHLLPEAYAARATVSMWDYLQEEMYTRKDDEKNEHRRALLAPAVRGALDDERRVKALKKNDPQNDTGQHQQMMYYVETFAAGTPFYWKVVLDDVTDLEFEAFVTTLVQFSRMPYIGGKSNVGLGEVAITFDRWMQIDSRLAPASTEIALPAGAAYAAHLRMEGAAIRAWLGGMG
jgi:CRISPR type IV-associated protein Csf2